MGDGFKLSYYILTFRCTSLFYRKCVVNMCLQLTLKFKDILHRQGRKLTLEEFWSEELSLLLRRKMEENEEEMEDEEEKEEEDVLETEDVVLITRMVQSNLPPLINIPGFSPSFS